MGDLAHAGEAGEVLILTPTGRDAHGARVLLEARGITCHACDDLEALVAAIGDTVGAVLIADEALAGSGLGRLAARLDAQPPWSDLPFVVLTQGGAAARRELARLRLPETLGNIVVLERPLNALTLVSAVASALRARRKQRQIGAFLTEREAAVRALTESEARFRHMADSAPAFIWMSGPDGGLTFVNMHFEYVFQMPPQYFLGDGWMRVLLENDAVEFRAAYDAAFAGRLPFRAETRVRDGAGQVRWLRCEGVPRTDNAGTFLGYTGCNVDITDARLATGELEDRVDARTAQLTQAINALHEEVLERERAEAALRQAQKMEAVGQLTGGIAHDFNNMLQGISSSLQLMRRRLAQGRMEEVGRFAEMADGSVARAAGLTHRLLAFARRQALQPRPTEVNALIEGMADLLRRTLGPAVMLDLALSDGRWPVICDPNQLESALLNLAINARDAMPGGGRLTVKTRDVKLPLPDVPGQDGVTPGDHVEVTIADSGTGMDEATRARAFEPFFTTKPFGQGTGLGLSQIYGFVRQSGGFVRLHSTPGLGTTVRLYLPRVATARADATAEVRPLALPEPAAKGESVLLVEDEAVIRDVTAERLRELGYRVTISRDGPGALALLRSGSPVDVLVTDVGLPNGLNGRQVAEAAREMRPGLPVVFVTGFAGTALDAELASGMAIINKPFELSELTTKIQSMLAG